MDGGLPGSSAHGEHPKFTAIIESASGPTHVLVKFSPPNQSPVGQRWSDLLVAEHIAHEVLTEAGLPAARSRIERYGDRTYLEVERFDRVDSDGRVGVTSLYAIDLEQYGNLDNWIDSATRLRDDRHIDSATCELVRLISTFGALIANTDRHFGNIAFYDDYGGRFSLAPVYDMLPMFFAPEHDQVTARVFQPPDPTSQTLHAYGRARALAEDYWRRCARDSQIGQEFQAISAACGATLEALPRTGAYTYQSEAG
jgi:serine/threonine protein kinase HipA of HipAB toxin-antitoxin module